jgi:hypothetical protein
VNRDLSKAKVKSECSQEMRRERKGASTVILSQLKLRPPKKPFHAGENGAIEKRRKIPPRFARSE